MKKSILLPALLMLAGSFSTFAQETTQDPNRVIIHSKDGTTKVYRFSDLEYMDFDQVDEPQLTIQIKEGTLTHNSVTFTVAGHYDHYNVIYGAYNENSRTLDVQTGPEFSLTNLNPETEYTLSVAPYDKYEIRGASDGLSFTTLAEPVETDPKVGDYYYSDGTWSDGGLISIDADGRNAVWSTTKPAPIAGKQVIGIVCVTDPSRISPDDLADGYTHGYVISTRNLTDPNKMNYAQHPETIWYGAYMSEGEETQVVKSIKSAYERLSGRADTYAVLANYPTTPETDCPMFYQATTSLGEAPANTSGWFVPSSGQLWDCIANFCSGQVANILAQNHTSTYDFTYFMSHEVNMNVKEEFMKVFELVPAEDKDEITVNDVNNPSPGISLRTSNRYQPDSTIIFNLGSTAPGFFEGMAAWRDEDCHARAFLAF